ncbi:MAG TPA: propanediol utilization protein [Elusimicrobia bacterium]|nr:propanediol utilization protein [Elusimicrobiota bacterium]HBT62154.1 propanediol utilization protein [Elusimicrobiota bacterium]
MNQAIGGVELSSMARGFDVTDTMLKTAPVTLLLARTICPGKYIVLVSGDVAEVQAGVEAGRARAGVSWVDHFLIANVHPDVLPAVSGTSLVDKLEALGVVEAFSVSALLEAADAAVKAATVRLIEVRLAMAMGGKAFVSMTGSVAAVETAVAAAAAAVGRRGLLVEKVVIPQPRPELLSELL